LEKDVNGGLKTEVEKTYSRLQPSAQVDYNIITNKKLDDFYFQNVRLNVDVKKVKLQLVGSILIIIFFRKLKRRRILQEPGIITSFLINM